LLLIALVIPAGCVDGCDSPPAAVSDNDADNDAGIVESGDVWTGPTRVAVAVVNTYPHDPGAFTQGLVYHDGVLFEGTGRYGESTLRRVALETGEVLQSISLNDRYFGEGIELHDGRIVQITWREHVGFVYDADTFELLDEFAIQTEGWGIAFDGQNYILSDGTSTLYTLDPVTFEQRELVQVRDGDEPVVRLNELEYIDGALWANVWLTDEIVIIDPATGLVTGRVDVSTLLPDRPSSNNAVPNGIAYDEAGDRLFVTGKRWPSLFEIRLVP
jgi:glutamine cyclotransferase